MKLNRWLVQTHRWIGIVLCLFFAMWFLSGMVMMYVPFPSLSQQQRLQLAEDVEPRNMRLSPGQAIAQANLKSLDRLRIIRRDGQVIYVLHPPNGKVVAVNALDGSVQRFDAAAAERIAKQFAGKQVSRLDGNIEYDQWVVSNDFDPYRPYFRAHIDDPEGTVLYVSAATGEVVQRTQRSERGWNYVGAVVHWIYPTVLRKHWVAWDQVVWWLSFTGIVGAMIGIWLGIARMRAALRIKGRGMSPYRGWMRWHHVMGLLAGLFVLTWITSGWLSMDHGRLFSNPYPTDKFVQGFRGKTLEQALAPITTEDLQLLGQFREAEFTVINGDVLMVARRANGQTIQFPGNRGRMSGLRELPEDLIYKAAQSAWPNTNITAIERPGLSDTYGQLRAGSLPPGTIRIKFDDPAQTWLHVDAESGTILSVMDRSRRLYRWFFNALHSLDIPGLVNKRPWWDAVMLLLLLLGFAFSTTGVIIGIKRLKTKLG